MLEIKVFFSNNSDRWHKDRLFFLNLFKDVLFGSEKGAVWFEGDITVRTPAGREFGPFRVKVCFSNEYYEGLVPPDVYLLSHRNKWLNIENSHIEKDWRLCLFVPLESQINFNDGDSFVKFIERLASFLIDSSNYQQEIKELGLEKAKWRGRQRSHGLEGVVQVLNEMQSSIYGPCPCGNGSDYLDCHHGKSLKMYLKSFSQKNLIENRW